MNQNLQSLLELFDKNNGVLMHKYWLHPAAISAAASVSYWKTGKEADPAELKRCEKIMKRKFGIFSNMRGLMRIPLLSEMENQPDPEAYITAVGEIYNILKEGRFLSTEFDVLSASMLYNYKDKVNIREIRDIIKVIYKKMQANHPMLTSYEDFPIATMIALTGTDDDALLADMEDCYKILKPHFAFMGEQVQTACAILATQEDTVKEKCDRFMNLYNALKAKGYSLRFSYTLPILAGLSGLKIPAENLVAEVCEAAEWLRHKHGFSWVNMGKGGRIAFAMLIYLESISGKDAAEKNSFIKSTLTSVITTQIIIEIIITMMILSEVHRQNTTKQNGNA